MSFSLPTGCDFRRQSIMFLFLAQVNSSRTKLPQWAKIVADPAAVAKFESLHDWIDSEGGAAWRKKFGKAAPASTLTGIWAEALSPSTVPYDGPTALTPIEQVTVYQYLSGARSDLTMGMLYVMIEGLGWRPGAVARGAAWPPSAQLSEFWHFYKDDDPRGALMIALSLLATTPDGHYSEVHDEIYRLATEVHRNEKSRLVSVV